MAITLANGFLYLPTLAAGAKFRVEVNSTGLDEGAELYLILVDRDTGYPCAVTPALNADNSYTADIDLYTDIVYSLFSASGRSARRWMDAEVIDTTNRRSVATGAAVMRNSALIVGSSQSVPEINTLLTTADFSAISSAVPETPNQTASLLLEILAMLQGK